jgi:hypothetical protein
MLRRSRPEPFILALTGAWIIGLFSASTAPLQDLWRPLLIGLLLATVLAILVAFIPGRGRWPSIVAGGVWLALLGAWPLALATAIVSGWRLSLDRLRGRQGRPPVRERADAQIARILNALGVAGVVVAFVSLATSGAIRLDQAATVAPIPQTADRPSIYLVLLDGYPALETLEEQFAYEATPFVSDLERRGFDIADRSRSNYNRTLLTLASMLHMDYVESLPGLSEAREGFAAQNRQLTAAINASPVIAMLETRGYETGSVSSSYGEAALTSVDHVSRTGAMTLFEEQLIRYTAAGNWVISQWPDLVASQHREGVLGVLAELRALPARTPGPQFALAHVFSPHPPFVFHRDGSPRPLLECYPRACGMTMTEVDRLGISPEAYGEAMVEQVDYLNDQLLRTVDAIIDRDPTAVVVLFSDHGGRFAEGPSGEHFRTFMAARTPGHDRLFDGDVSLVNVFPTLLNAYFGTEFSLRDYRAAWAPDDAPLEPEPIESGEIR